MIQFYINCVFTSVPLAFDYLKVVFQLISTMFQFHFNYLSTCLIRCSNLHIDYPMNYNDLDFFSTLF